MICHQAAVASSTSLSIDVPDCLAFRQWTRRRSFASSASSPASLAARTSRRTSPPKTSMSDLIVAVRFDRSASECLAELRRLAVAKDTNKKSRDLTLAQLHGSARPAPGQSRPSPISRPGSLGSRQDETGEARQLPSETSPCGRFWRRGRLPKHQRQPSAAKCGPALVTGTKEQPCFDIAETVRLQPPDREQLRPKCNCLPLQWSAVIIVTVVSQQRSEMLRQAANRS
jgi:hypothetical protein